MGRKNWLTLFVKKRARETGIRERQTKSAQNGEVGWVGRGVSMCSLRMTGEVEIPRKEPVQQSKGTGQRRLGRATNSPATSITAGGSPRKKALTQVWVQVSVRGGGKKFNNPKKN